MSEKRSFVGVAGTAFVPMAVVWITRLIGFPLEAVGLAALAITPVFFVSMAFLEWMDKRQTDQRRKP